MYYTPLKRKLYLKFCLTILRHLIFSQLCLRSKLSVENHLSRLDENFLKNEELKKWKRNWRWNLIDKYCSGDESPRRWRSGCEWQEVGEVNPCLSFEEAQGWIHWSYPQLYLPKILLTVAKTDNEQLKTEQIATRRVKIQDLSCQNQIRMCMLIPLYQESLLDYQNLYYGMFTYILALS